MEMDKKVQGGSLKISEDVILMVTKQTVLEIPGVDSLAHGKFNLKNFVVRSDIESSIKVTLNVDVAQIDISVNLKYGYKIKDVAQRIQENVKATVQNMTGVTVSKVNVFIAGVAKEENF